MLDLSIIITTWNGKDLLDRLLFSIFSHTYGLNFEVIVIDNNSTDGTEQMLRDKYSNAANFRFIKNNHNAGFGRANNQGLRIAQGEFVLFMNPDMEIRENVFLPLIEKMRADRQIGILGCKLLYPDGSLQKSVKGEVNFLSQILILLKLHHFFYSIPALAKYLQRDFDYEQEQNVAQVMGAFTLMPKTVMDKIGGWDENYFLWWEDVELNQAVRSIGYSVVYMPTASVIHYEGKSFAQVPSLAKQRAFNRGMRIYFRRHHPYWQYLIIYLLSPFSLLLAWLTQVFKVKPRPQSSI